MCREILGKQLPPKFAHGLITPMFSPYHNFLTIGKRVFLSTAVPKCHFFYQNSGDHYNSLHKRAALIMEVLVPSCPQITSKSRPSATAWVSISAAADKYKWGISTAPLTPIVIQNSLSIISVCVTQPSTDHQLMCVQCVCVYCFKQPAAFQSTDYLV